MRIRRSAIRAVPFLVLAMLAPAHALAQARTGAELRPLIVVGDVVIGPLAELEREAFLNAIRPGVLAVTPLSADSAIARFGDVARDGALLITLREDVAANVAAAPVASNRQQPLIVVNGVVIGSNVSIFPMLDRSNIESIEIMRGPAAASAYGSRGANGVVVIRTKQPGLL